MVVKTILISFFLILLTVPSQGTDNESWLLQRSHEDIITDERFVKLIDAIVPDTMNWRNFVKQYLELPMPPDDHGPSLFENRYFTLSGFKSFSYPQRIFFWYDLKENTGIFALSYDLDHSEPTVYFLTTQYLKNQIPQIFYSHYTAWLHRQNAKAVKEQWFVKSKNNLKELHEQTLLLFKADKKSEAASKLYSALGEQPWDITKENVVLFNDCGYFLEQAARYRDAIAILNAVVAKFPNRTVAYLNRADAYWGIQQKNEAFANYERYVALMQQAGKEAKIPKRVTDLLKKK